MLKAKVMKWYARKEVNQEQSEQNEVDGMKKKADSTGKVMHAPMPNQSSIHQGLVKEYQQKPGSKWAYHTMP